MAELFTEESARFFCETLCWREREKWKLVKSYWSTHSVLLTEKNNISSPSLPTLCRRGSPCALWSGPDCRGRFACTRRRGTPVGGTSRARRDRWCEGTRAASSAPPSRSRCCACRTSARRESPNSCCRRPSPPPASQRRVQVLREGRRRKCRTWFADNLLMVKEKQKRPEKTEQRNSKSKQHVRRTLTTTTRLCSWWRHGGLVRWRTRVFASPHKYM